MKECYAKGSGDTIPPLLQHVIIYFLQKGITEEKAIDFFERYNNNGWKKWNGQQVKNWKTLACDEIWHMTRPQYR